MYGSWKSIIPIIAGAVMILSARVSIRQRIENDRSPNLSEALLMHPLYVVVAHKSKMEVSPGVA